MTKTQPHEFLANIFSGLSDNNGHDDLIKRIKTTI